MLEVSKYFGVSPSGKASDSDSDISKVRILLPQPFDFNTQTVFFYQNLYYFDIIFDSYIFDNKNQLCHIEFSE